jgi:hypothetical protein
MKKNMWRKTKEGRNKRPERQIIKKGRMGGRGDRVRKT